MGTGTPVKWHKILNLSSLHLNGLPEKYGTSEKVSEVLSDPWVGRPHGKWAQWE